jgi:hypothetical protein
MKLLSMICLVAIGFAWMPAREHTPYASMPGRDSLPPMPAVPDIKKGWIGTYTYTVRLRGSGNQPKPYSFYAHFHRVHTGFVELTREYRGAIRVNQPDKYNADRWESWTRTGSKQSWNYINDTLKAVTVITSDACCRTPHDHIHIVRAGDANNWQIGETHNYDLQIDYLTETYILSVPLSTTKAEGHEVWKVNKDAKIKNDFLRNVDEKMTENFRTSGYVNAADTVMGTFKKGQKEIRIHRVFPYSYTDFLWHQANSEPLYITPAAKGTIEFSLVLRKVD